MGETLSYAERQARLDDLDEDFLALLFDPDGYEEGKYAALLSGGGVVKSGLSIQYFGDALNNTDLIEIMVWYYQTHDCPIEIEYKYFKKNLPPIPDRFPIQADHVFYTVTCPPFMYQGGVESFGNVAAAVGCGKRLAA
jgi:hypothetical protein